MAHEINNPLGGILNAIDTLKQHGERPEVRSRTLDLIERGLKGIRDVVRTALVTYRADTDRRDLTGTDLDDLKLLVDAGDPPQGIDVGLANAADGDLASRASIVRQIVLNLLLNACSATPAGGTIAFAATIEGDSLSDCSSWTRAPVWAPPRWTC